MHGRADEDADELGAAEARRARVYEGRTEREWSKVEAAAEGQSRGGITSASPSSVRFTIAAAGSEGRSG